VLHFSEPQGTLGVASNFLNWAIYGWFLFEFLYTLRLAPDNREYLRHNKLDLTVLLLTVPLLPGIFQALWVLRLLRLIDMLPTLLGRFVNITLLPYAIVLAFIGVFGGGLAFAHFENLSVFDGMYWANTTINTVGYGDVSAQTPAGKVLSMVLQWTGNVILAMLIGGVAAFAQQLLLGEGVEKLEKDVEQIGEDVEEVEEDVENLLENVRGLSGPDRLILQELSRIRARLDEVHPSGPQP
jgi:voltage-gated potassium channel